MVSISGSDYSLVSIPSNADTVKVQKRADKHLSETRGDATCVRGIVANERMSESLRACVVATLNSHLNNNRNGLKSGT